MNSIKRTKEYSNGELTIVWKPGLCYHSERCVKGLPDVFNTNQRPWINAEGAASEAIIDQVRQCPSGALSYYLNATGEPRVEDQQGGAKVEALPNGPLIIQGPVQVKNAKGEVVEIEQNAALCRCGASGKKPFCDGSHKKIKFKD